MSTLEVPSPTGKLFILLLKTFLEKERFVQCTHWKGNPYFTVSNTSVCFTYDVFMCVSFPKVIPHEDNQAPGFSRCWVPNSSVPQLLERA